MKTNKGLKLRIDGFFSGVLPMLMFGLFSSNEKNHDVKDDKVQNSVLSCVSFSDVNHDFVSVDLTDPLGYDELKALKLEGYVVVKFVVQKGFFETAYLIRDSSYVESDDFKDGYSDDGEFHVQEGLRIVQPGSYVEEGDSVEGISNSLNEKTSEADVLT